MARTPRPTDFPVTVDGIGTFTFARIAMREQIAIGVETARLCEGLPLGSLDPSFQNLIGWIAELKTLTVVAPDGWDIDGMDPFDQDSYAQIAKVWSALRDKQNSFRPGYGKGGQAAGEGAGGLGGVLVSPEVQPAAD